MSRDNVEITETNRRWLDDAISRISYMESDALRYNVEFYTVLCSDANRRVIEFDKDSDVELLFMYRELLSNYWSEIVRRMES